jgi:drug/metabolite transporter (DMT)-like permease
MELWFWAAVGSAVMSGVGNFLFKVAAKRSYSSEMFSMYGGVTSVVVTLPLALLVSGPHISLFAALVAFGAGFIAAGAGIMKVYALRHIDTTIFFPLYKLASPLFAILIGVVVFAESFTTPEMVGLLLGLTVPLLLINKIEHSRQQNLTAGLVLLLGGAIISATAAGLNKYSTDLWNDVWWLLTISSLGVFIGALTTVAWKSGVRGIKRAIWTDSDTEAAGLAALRGLVMCVALWLGLYAFVRGGSLAVVHTIQSMYILIPIMLSIIFYNEHFNLQKGLAIVLSIAALAFFH